MIYLSSDHLDLLLPPLQVCVEDLDYKTPFTYLAALLRQIYSVVPNIDVAMLQRAWIELEYHVYILRENKGRTCGTVG